MESTCAVVDVTTSKTEIPLVTFANGKLKKDVDVKDLKIRYFYNASTEDGLHRKRAKKILLADNGRLQYSGYNFGPNAPRTVGICRYHVGIHNKIDGTLKVIPASLFHMKPHLCDDESAEDTSNLTFKEKVDNLTSAFGSKRKRRNIESRKTNLVEEENIMATADSIVKEAVVEEPTAGNTTSVESGQAESIPPRNNEAKAPAEVYDINSIISQDEYDALVGFAEELCSASIETIQNWKAEAKYSNYVSSWLPELALKTSKKMQTAVLLLYYNYLMELLKLRFPELRKKDPLPHIVEPVKSSLLDKFTLKCEQQNGKFNRTIPQRLKDKIISYALVIALIIENFVLDLSSVQVDFKVPQKRLLSISYALGCHVMAQKSLTGVQMKLIQLKIPLFVFNNKGPQRMKK